MTDNSSQLQKQSFKTNFKVDSLLALSFDITVDCQFKLAEKIRCAPNTQGLNWFPHIPIFEGWHCLIILDS